LNQHQDKLNYDARKFDVWTGASMHWDDKSFDHRLNEHTGKIKACKLTERIPPDQYNKMLVVGCGNGGELKAISNAGYNATGISFCNKEAFDIAVQSGCDLRSMDMHDMKFELYSFDSVYATHSLEHSISIWMVLGEIWMSLRDGGLMWIVLPTPLFSDKDGPSSQHTMLLDEWFMVPCLKKAGFEILYSVNSVTNYDFLCKKMPRDKVEPWHAKKYRDLEVLRLEHPEVGDE